jgi:tetratricopeptide (TPR) repeat protein
MKKLITGVLLLMITVGEVAVAGEGGTRSPFSLGAGARDLGLGGADLVHAAPSAAAYWNPAGLALAQRYSLQAFHSGLYGSEAGYQYFGFAVPTMDFGCFGVGIFRLGIGGIEVRDAHNLYLGETSDSRLGLYAAYGHGLSGYDLGLSVNVEQHSPGDYSAASSPGITLAVGRRFSPGYRRIPEVGAAVIARNVVRPSIKLDEHSVTYPYAIDGGMSVRLLPTSSRDHVLALAGKLTKVEGLDTRVAVGVEYTGYDCIGLRVGVRDGDASFGLGIFYRYVGFDYVLVKRDLGNLHLFGLTAGFGMPVSRKRELRERRREAEFDRLLKKRFAESNRATVEGLVDQGRQKESRGDLEQAAMLYEKAVFIAAGANMDTVEISGLAAGARRRLAALEREARFNRNREAAEAKFDSGDYLGARYYADLALSLVPDSPVAVDLVEKAEIAIQENISREQEIERGLLMVDSLTSYGRVGEALVAARSLTGTAGEDPRVRLALKGAEFAFWQGITEDALAAGDYPRARAALDSAASRFPDHPWSEKLAGRMAGIQESGRPVTAGGTAVQRSEPRVEDLDPGIREEVAATYRRGQDYFEAGRLREAVAEWERVDALAPGYRSVRRYLVDAYKFLGVELYTGSRLKEAVEVWNKAARLAPESGEIANYIRRTEHEIRKLEEISYDRR